MRPSILALALLLAACRKDAPKPEATSSAPPVDAAAIARVDAGAPTFSVMGMECGNRSSPTAPLDYQVIEAMRRGNDKTLERMSRERFDVAAAVALGKRLGQATPIIACEPFGSGGYRVRYQATDVKEQEIRLTWERHGHGYRLVEVENNGW